MRLRLLFQFGFNNRKLHLNAPSALRSVAAKSNAFNNMIEFMSYVEKKRMKIIPSGFYVYNELNERKRQGGGNEIIQIQLEKSDNNVIFIP